MTKDKATRRPIGLAILTIRARKEIRWAMARLRNYGIPKMGR